MAVVPSDVSIMQPSMTFSPSSRARRSIATPGASPPIFISFRLMPRTPAAANASRSAMLCTDSSATMGRSVCAWT